MSKGRTEAVIERLHGLHPKMIDLSLGRLEALLEKLGHPERSLPPVVHVAGTNGKGSTCAFLRALAEAAGQRVHVYISPHLVQFNERIRLAGELVSEPVLVEALEEVERVNAGAPITVFEVITAVALLLFSRVPADLCVVEVGLGGRFDATNVVTPVVSAIASISIDHREYLGDDIRGIAAEKAGILKSGAPGVTGLQQPEVLEVLDREAAKQGVSLLARDRDWHIARHGNGLRYSDADGAVDLPLPALPGEHQLDNAGIAVAAMRAAAKTAIPLSWLAEGLARAEWPARMQRLTGLLAKDLPDGWELWLDGGHNPGAGVMLAGHLRGWKDRPAHVIVGMKQAKDAGQFLASVLPEADTVWAIAEPGQYLALPVEAIVRASGGKAIPGPTVREAMAAILKQAEAGSVPGRILICGSLYLAGEILKLDQGLA
ncbi:Dihydrofolate synthase [Granulibacter bethesdensis]|uniref:bifunctional folylpolyglutamate synthase/dihydrofolate synthase n=1 Tax=Granulibacter bethesdensis TaxID=364410 RepID=UPI00090AC858|nr:folylpolyglutamate synthase/dihydrofolate synthase family protein [Granulibacter bethesdensis]APH57837.1 Dihydrofolate synthase [Granulibacter bethesdensis]